MKKLLTLLALSAIAGSVAHAQVYINELMANAPGADSSAVRGLEFFELRGTPSLGLGGYYLLSLEGQGTTGKGDINQYFDLGSFSLGGNGYLSAVQFNSPYSIAAGGTIISNTTSFGWGQVNTAQGSSVGHSADAAQVDLENSATTVLLINIGAGAAPTLTTDLDSDNNGTLELPAGWSILDSIGLADGATPLAADVSYGAITFRIGGVGADNAGNVVEVAATGANLYVARQGDSTGSTANDWFGAVLIGSSPNFVITNATASFYNDKTLADLNLGGVNPVPEPSTWALLGLGIAGLGVRQIRRFPFSKR